MSPTKISIKGESSSGKTVDDRKTTGGTPNPGEEAIQEKFVKSGNFYNVSSGKQLSTWRVSKCQRWMTHREQSPDPKELS